MGLSDKQLRAYPPTRKRSWPRNYGGNYGDGSDLPLWNGLARSLNTIAVRVGDVGTKQYLQLRLQHLATEYAGPHQRCGSGADSHGQPDQGCYAHGAGAAFQIFYDGKYTTPHLYTRVLDRDSNIYLENNAFQLSGTDPHDTAYVMNRLLKNVLFSSVRVLPAAALTPTAWRPLSTRPVLPAAKRICGSWAAHYYVTAVVGI